MLIVEGAVRGGYGGGGFHKAQTRSSSERRVASPTHHKAFESSLEHYHGDQGAPLWSQILVGEVPEPVFQEPPRYRPPMHGRGSPVKVE